MGIPRTGRIEAGTGVPPSAPRSRLPFIWTSHGTTGTRENPRLLKFQVFSRIRSRTSLDWFQKKMAVVSSIGSRSVPHRRVRIPRDVAAVHLNEAG